MRIDRATNFDRLRGHPDPILTDQTRRQEDQVERARKGMTEKARRSEQRLDSLQVSRERQRAQEAGPSGPGSPPRNPSRPGGNRLDVRA